MTAPARSGRSPVARADAPAQRSTLRSVALPTEHGGWGLTLEPGLLGLLIEPHVAGVLLAVAAVVAFLARTPLKVVLVDRWRGRTLDRTRVALRLAAAELLALAALIAGAALLADGSFWVPLVVAAPLVLLELWFDMRSRSRRLVPELAGAVGVCAVAASIVLAGGGDSRLAAAVWLVPAARVATSIPFVRAQIARLHGRATAPARLLVADAIGVAIAAVAVALEPAVLGGSLAVLAAVVYQRTSASGPVPRPTVLGVRQMLLGVGVVLATALSVLIA
ncbi:MAG TPA: YwiC-like family protein [Acidimicrobiales bacterium]